VGKNGDDHNLVAYFHGAVDSGPPMNPEQEVQIGRYADKNKEYNKEKNERVQIPSLDSSEYATVIGYIKQDTRSNG
jgi:hypothetical protein